MGFSRQFRFLSPPYSPTWPADSDLRVLSVIFSNSRFQFATFAGAPLPEAIAYRFFLVPFSTHVTELIL